MGVSGGRGGEVGVGGGRGGEMGVGGVRVGKVSVGEVREGEVGVGVTVEVGAIGGRERVFVLVEGGETRWVQCYCLYVRIHYGT